MKSSNVQHQGFSVTKHDRHSLLKQKSKILWFTGLSGSGKSTLANALAAKLHKEGFATYNLDGDNIRMGLNGDLGFSEEDRTENIRRIGEVAKLFVDAGIIVLTSFISPLHKDRDRVRNLVEEGEFVEIFVDCPLEICEQRDIKGLYKKAREGKIPEFTGISSPFEVPNNPEITIKTHESSLDDSVDYLWIKLEKNLRNQN